MGTQQDVLQAQLQKTKLLREIAMHHLQVGKLEAQLKQLLNRSQESPDIEPADLFETPLVQTYADLLAAAQIQNPEIAGAQKMIERQSLQVDLARKDFYPDFNVQYMWQRTDPAQFRAYYMLSVGIKVPIYRSRKQRPELAQAESEQLRARSELQEQSQRLAGDLRSQYVIVQQTSELLKIHREGLSPQARAEFQSSLAAYQSNKQDFQVLLTAFLDVLHLDEDYWQNVAEYETAIARLEQLTGLSLHEEGVKQ
jgi:outer membrane protein TolC